MSLSRKELAIAVKLLDEGKLSIPTEKQIEYLWKHLPNKYNPTLKPTQPVICLTREARVAILHLRRKRREVLYHPEDRTYIPDDLCVTGESNGVNRDKSMSDIMNHEEFDEYREDDLE